MLAVVPILLLACAVAFVVARGSGEDRLGTGRLPRSRRPIPIPVRVESDSPRRRPRT